ncbi:DUF4156 domain-containing protein [Pontibacter pudoricolor]|uniref:DUF4156 domain-containing protein n=1 Tax=Pontibacter pudoricolor TaxID=2694930 RepID=UPI001390F31A|nr:DUF4156 domain-containing protein [Pontibacter pudoricolor]
MKTLTFLLTSFVLSASVCMAQVDTVYTHTSKIPCIVKEITPEFVKYSLPGEELINTVYKNTIRKIVFTSGRVEAFTPSAQYKKVNNLHAFENVTLTLGENEVNGFLKLGEASSIAQGNTMFSGLNQVEDRAQKRLKIFAAMMGGNLVYITQQNATKASAWGSTNAYYSKPTESFLTGMVYTTHVPDIDKFKARIGNKTEFNAVESASFTGTTTSIRVYPSKRTLKLKSIKEENGLLTIEGNLEGASKYKTFRVASFDEDFFYIFYEDKGTAYNIKIKL